MDDDADPTLPLGADSRRDTVASDPRDDDRAREDAPVEEGTAATRATLDVGELPTELANFGRPVVQLPDRFRCISVLGRGGMGMVYRVFDQTLGREVALKKIAPDALSGSARARFLREARAAAKLDHPNLVTLHDVSEEGGYIVMELVPGETLRDRVRGCGPQPPDEVRRIGGALLAALAAAHDEGIVHRDVKPSNVLLREDGVVKLADFGVATFGDGELTTTGDVIGTPAFMAPEQLRGRRVDLRADLYSAGATLFEAATARRFHGEDGPEEDPRGALLAATGDAALASAIAGSLRERPEERYDDAAAFGAALAARLAPRARRRGPAWLAATVALVLAGGVAANLLSTEPEPAPAVADLPSSTVPTLALLPFSGGSFEERLDFAPLGLAQLLGRRLSHSDAVRVLGVYRVRDHVAPADVDDPDAWRAAAARLGATALARGEIAAAGPEEIDVTVHVLGTDGAEVRTFQRRTSLAALPDTVSALAPAVASTVLGDEVRLPSASGAPLEVERLVQLGVAALERNELAAARRRLEEAKTLAPDHAETHYYLALLHWWRSASTGDELDAIARALALPLPTRQRELLRGLDGLVRQRFPDVIEHFRDLVERYPLDRDARYGLVEALYHGGHPEEAVRAHERLLALSPRFFLGASHALEHHIKRGRLEEATALLERWGPKPATEALWRARLALAAGDVRGAAALVERALERDGEPDPLLRRTLVEIYAVDGRHELARAAADELADRDAGYRALARAGIARALGESMNEGADGAVREEASRWPMRAHHAALLGVPRMKPWEPRLDLLALGFDELAGEHPQRALELRRLELGGRSIASDVGAVFAARAVGGDEADALIARAADSGFPEVAAVAKAITASRAGRHAAAERAYQRALASGVESRFRHHELLGVARARVAQDDRRGARAACERIRHPRWFTWGWASAVAGCEALGL